MRRALQALDEFLWLRAEGSTRWLAVLRIALVLLLWASWGLTFVLHLDLEPTRVALALVFDLASIALLCGLFTRASAIVTAGALVAALLVLDPTDGSSIWWDQPRLLTALLCALLALTPSGRSLSIDRWLALRRATAEAPAPDERAPLWSLRLLQLCSSILFGATALWQSRAGWLDAELALAPDAAPPSWAPALALAMPLLNGALAVGPLIPKLRAPALLAGSVAYLALYTLMFADMVSLIAVFMLLTFVPPSAAHRTIDRMHGRASGAQPLGGG